MPLLLPVIAKARMTHNKFEQVYMCPGDKSHSIVDVTFFLDLPNTNQKPNFMHVYLSDEKNLAEPRDEDMIFCRIPLGLAEVAPELGKIVVGKNQVLYFKIDGEGPVNVRVSGLEERNDTVVQSGAISRLKTKAKGIHEIIKMDNPLTSFFSGTLIVTNPTNTKDECFVWVTDNTDVKNVNDRQGDRVQKLFVEKGETVLVENILLKPNERIYVSNNVIGTNFLLDGVVVSEMVE